MRLLGATAGAVAFLLSHIVERSVWSAFDGAYKPWFLNSGRAALLTAAVVFTAGMFAGAVTARARSIDAGLSVGAGAVAAAIVVLFWTGAGTLFPIAIAIAALVLVVSGVAGASVSALLRPKR